MNVLILKCFVAEGERNMSRLATTAAAEGPTRRLPAWMSAVPTVVKSTNVSVRRVCTAGSVGVSCETDEQCLTVRTRDEPRRRRQMKSDEREKLVFAGTGHQRRGRKRKSIDEAETRDGADDVVSNTGENEEVGRKLRGQVSRRRQNVKVNGHQVDGGSDTTSLHDDEIELTVEELVTIAEENIKSYNDALQPLGESTLECGGRMTPPENVDGSHHYASACTEKVIEDLSNEEIAAGAVNESCDPAREMLDLLLGPLLKKPLKEDKNE